MKTLTAACGAGRQSIDQWAEPFHRGTKRLEARLTTRKPISKLESKGHRIVGGFIGIMRSLVAVRLTAICTLLSFIMVSQVSCSGVFELDLLSFKNQQGVNANNNCCNGRKLAGSMGPCSQSCRTFFRICLKHYQVHISTDSQCTFGEIITPVLGNNSFIPRHSAEFHNPSRFPFDFSWPGTFSLIIEAWHDSTYNGPRPGSPRELIYRMANQSSLEVGETWTRGPTTTTSSIRLDFKYRVICDKNYYGSGCTDLCRPRDDRFGHWNCTANGTKVCLDGWTGPYCDKAICLSGCHSEHGTCTNPNECICRLGWQGRFCDECVVYPGCDTNHGTCNEAFQCNCEEGWGGSFCNQDLNFCTHHQPCKNSATCTNTGQGSYTCTCPIGFTGTNCEIEVDDCHRQPCANGGTCQDLGTSYRCMCPPGFHGYHCESTATSCSALPCKNQGVCRDVGDSYMCMCQAGYTGTNCENEINECQSNPCKNNARCVDELDGFRCVCPAGFSGLTCEINYNNCENNPCMNGGQCIDEDNNYRCQCLPGFVGPVCETTVNFCITAPCANGGTCIEVVNSFKCTCAPGFTGTTCSQNIDDCASSPCKNGGTCRDRVAEYECSCPTGFYGRDCTETTATASPVTNNETPVESGSTVNSKTPASQVKSDEEDDSLTMQQIVLIVCLGAGIPIVIIIFVVIFFLCKKSRNEKSVEAEQNEANSMNNKQCIQKNILNSFPSKPLSSKVTNEEIDFSPKAANSKQHNLEKSTNKNFKDNNNSNEENSLDSIIIDTKSKKQYKKVDSDAMSIESTVVDISETQDIHVVKEKNTVDSMDPSNHLYYDYEKHRHLYPSTTCTTQDGMLATEV
ncbi:delta-like protein D isoform X2 [Lingula anatina]|uniref:Delta-like protein n=1 Tax=Lingula anatina TaxID=7574 RepID=A0A1S3I767_LINAN|nr:delta-like protein D isoform X2 [Lingula anatina]|eukprot:XP_013393696.1 delta-like protein D isoform X2 [Lingula anatina]